MIPPVPFAAFVMTPLDTIEPSQEATGVFRALGDWHLIHHRWKAAAECYLLLPLANRFIPGEQIPDTGDGDPHRPGVGHGGHA